MPRKWADLTTLGSDDIITLHTCAYFSPGHLSQLLLRLHSLAVGRHDWMPDVSCPSGIVLFLEWPDGFQASD